MKNALHRSTFVSTRHDLERIIEALVSAVADIEGVSVYELQPLYTAIDPDSLCLLVRDWTSELTIEFQYCGYQVRVSTGDQTTVEVVDG
ncbi:hypothetical protein EA473_06215 [Natrarchaeobius chitinivorans]|uniref:Halobacterial output domain-containing protein n=1 Tax=Natrarchaeobius chitinivorans TaxID=1679083 RepID=A0A3N6MJ31_NATCH|nr:hypothetical protein EA473_06215 [Natrarchaeobius chitinivorans]